MPKKFYDAIFALNIIFQAAVSGVVPGGLVFLGVYFLEKKFDIPDALFAIGIVVAVLVGVFCLFKYAIKATDILSKMSKDENKKNRS